MKFFKALIDMFKPKLEILPNGEHWKKRLYEDYGDVELEEITVQIDNIEFPREYRFLMGRPLDSAAFTFDLHISSEEIDKKSYHFTYEQECFHLDSRDYAAMDEGSKIKLHRIICLGLTECLDDMDYPIKRLQKFRILIPPYQSMQKEYRKNKKLLREIKRDTVLKNIITDDVGLFMLGIEVMTKAQCMSAVSAKTELKIKESKVWKTDTVKPKTKKYKGKTS